MGRTRVYASGRDRVRAFRARIRASAAHRLDAPTPPVVAVVDHSDPVGVLAEWAKKTLVVPPGHYLAGEPMALQAFAVDWLRSTWTSHESALSTARKNAKSAIAAVLALGYLVGPLRRPGWRAAVASVTKEKAGELRRQVREIAEASGLDVRVRRSPYPGVIESATAPVDDASLAVYLGELFEAGRAPATAALAVAAVRFRAKLAGQPAPAGEATARVLGGYRRTAADRGRGQAAPLRADGLAAILATADRPRTDGRGVESHTTAHRRGRLDAVIASLLFMGGLRRSEVSALEWRDVSDARDGDGVLLTVRTSKTNQEGDAADVRYLKNGAANAIRTLRAAAADAAPTDRVIGLSPLQIQRRFTAAARAAGIEARVTAHSSRVGLASELTARGASTTEVMLAGNWKTARMVAHYSAGATAERGAVRKYL